MYSSITIVDAINSDRVRQAEAARRAREGSFEPVAQPRRRRRLRSLASRFAFAR
jgi:hypothetical protein